MFHKTGLVGAVTFAAISSAAFAQAPAAPPAAAPAPAAKGPPLALAVEAAQIANTTCAANGYKVTTVVLDSAGAMKAVLVSDGAAPRTVGIATRKANTVLAYKVPTAVIGERVKTDAALKAKIDADPSQITWAGGQPLMSGGELIGAIAVSGAPGGDKDDACIDAAMTKVKARL